MKPRCDCYYEQPENRKPNKVTKEMLQDKELMRQHIRDQLSCSASDGFHEVGWHYKRKSTHEEEIPEKNDDTHSEKYCILGYILTSIIFCFVIYFWVRFYTPH